jgi:magnesium-protoporphyrin IX monomethyl ester (oxidative) cyclase
MKDLAHSADASTVEEAMAAQNYEQAIIDSEGATALAMQNTLLTPRFYTTDFDEMDAIDVSPVREDWDKLIAQMKSDPNKGHFKKNEDWDHIDWDGMEPKLKAEFIDFLVSSCTAEFSGCVLYKEMKRRGNNEDIVTLFQLMARDEARHAGFINDALREAGIAVNLGFLTQKKKYTYFRPKFIYYATYLREDRLRPLHHDLPPPGGEPRASVPPDLQVVQGMVQRRVLPRGGLRAADEDRSEADESFVNKLWIKFFLTAVYSTMYVRDHQRPAFHKALGVDPDWYAHEVFTKTPRSRNRSSRSRSISTTRAGRRG